MTSGGAECIEPKYDAYVLVGLGLRMFRAARHCLGTIVERWKVEKKLMLSDEEMSRLILSDLETTLAKAVMIKLRQVTSAPALLIATPYSGSGADSAVWTRLEKRGLLTRLANSYNVASERLSAVYGVRFMPQPQETLGGNGVTTLEVYTRGVSAMVERASDDTHLSGDFGAILPRAALRALAVETSATP